MRQEQTQTSIKAEAAVRKAFDEMTGTGNGVPALIAVSYAPSAVNLQVMTDKERKALEKATKAAQRKAERKRA